MNDRKNCRVVWITGGTKGLGLALVEHFAGEGCQVIATYGLDDYAACRLRSRLSVDVIKADVRDETALQAVADEIADRYGHLDVLINNAGIGLTGSVEQVSAQQFCDVIDVNVTGKYRCIRVALPLLRKSEYGCIVNVASASGVNASDFMSAYCVSASAILMLTKCAAKDLSVWKIRVNAVSPSMMECGIAQRCFSQEDRDLVRSLNPMKRLGTSEDSVNCIAWLCSKQSTYINGENILLTGGK